MKDDALKVRDAVVLRSGKASVGGEISWIKRFPDAHRLAGHGLLAYPDSQAARIVSLITVFAVGGVVGAAVAFANTPVRTEVLALSEGCRATIEAARELDAAVIALDAAREARQEAGDAYDDRVSGGTADDIEEALALVDERQNALSGAGTTRTVARRAFLDADNRCITELSKVRG